VKRLADCERGQVVLLLRCTPHACRYLDGELVIVGNRSFSEDIWVHLLDGAEQDQILLFKSTEVEG
jgi:hypothetical protein